MAKTQVNLQTIEETIFDISIEETISALQEASGGVGIALDLAERFLLESPRYHDVVAKANMTPGAMHKRLVRDNQAYRELVEKIEKLTKIISGEVKAHDGKAYQINHNTSVSMEKDRWDAVRQESLLAITDRYNKLMAEELKNFEEDVLALFAENDEAWKRFKGEK